MNEEEMAALFEAEASLSVYLHIVCGEDEDTYAPVGSSIVDRLRFIRDTLDSMI